MLSSSPCPPFIRLRRVAAAGRMLQLFDVRSGGRRTLFFNATRCRESALGSNFLINAGKRLAAPAFAEDTASKHRREPMMPTITPFLWFDTQAEEAMTSKRVMNAMLQMDKLDLNRLEQAYNGE
jgi:hypothetical protein